MSLLLCLLAFQSLPTTALDRAHDARIVAPNGVAGAGFGSALALEGDTLAVAASDSVSNNSVYVFRETGAGWTLETEIQVAEQNFGYAIALSGERLVVGNFRANASQGNARVYLRTGTSWALEALLTPPVETQQQIFGRAVAIDGRRIAVGASFAPGPVAVCGAVFVYELTAGGWAQTARITASTPEYGALFGDSLALEGTTLCVGAPKRGLDDYGAIYDFRLVGGSWVEQQIITHTFGGGWLTSVSELGCALALEGDVLVATTRSPNRHSVVFERNAGTWGAGQSIYTALGSGQGVSVDVEGDTIVTGGGWYGQWPNYQGSLAVWKRQHNGWRERERLVIAPGETNAAIGDAVAIDGGRIFSGARPATGVTANTGAVYVHVGVPTWTGETYCHGDGQAVGCPCAWNSGVPNGPGCQSSAHRGALLLARGSTSIAQNDLEIVASQMPPGHAAMLVYRAQPANGGAGVPFENGLRCGAGAGGRLGIVTNHNGDVVWNAALATQVGASVGSETYFQVWYRDAQAWCGHLANTSNGVRIVFTP